MNPLNLIRAIETTTARAEQLKALFRISAIPTLVEEDGVPLQLLMVTPQGLTVRKPINNGKTNGHNPFLPYERDLFVGDLGENHVALLNKFPATPGHLLVITREFEEQTSPLNEADFTALAHVMRELDGLVIFNGGHGAGASQRHKHMQLIPGQRVFISPWLRRNSRPLEVVEQPELLFRNVFTVLDERLLAHPDRLGAHLLQAYEQLLKRLALTVRDGELPPYNLLATRRWMMAIPRIASVWSRDELRIPINAIGFSGNLLIYSPKQEAIIRELGLRRILADVTAT